MTKKKEVDDAAGGVTPTASPGRRKKKSITKVVYYCEECRFHLVEDKKENKCIDCDKEMKEIGYVEYAED